MSSSPDLRLTATTMADALGGFDRDSVQAAARAMLAGTSVANALDDARSLIDVSKLKLKRGG